MPSRTDDPSRSETQIETRAEPQIETVPVDPQTTDDDLLTEESFWAICSSNQRAGRWEPADEIHARAVCGEVTLDFTRAELPPSGMIEIHAWAICGEVKIIVPDGAEIELEGEPVLGSIEQQVRRKGARERIREWVTGERDEDLPAPPPAPEPPYFRIDCHAILGSIKVTGR
jgi:hypothetical protein